MAQVVMIAAMALGAGATIYSGYSADKAAKSQASAIEEQGVVARQEAERLAQQKETERRKFLATQRMAYLANGVSLLGTPGIVGEDTNLEFTNEIKAIREAGSARERYLLNEAKQVRKSGRAQLVSSIFSAAGTAASMYGKKG